MDKEKRVIRHLETIKSFQPFVYAVLIITLFLFTTSCGIERADYVPVESFEAHSYQPVLTDIAEISAIEGNADIEFPPSAYEIMNWVCFI